MKTPDVPRRSRPGRPARFAGLPATGLACGAALVAVAGFVGACSSEAPGASGSGRTSAPSDDSGLASSVFGDPADAASGVRPGTTAPIVDAGADASLSSGPPAAFRCAPGSRTGSLAGAVDAGAGDVVVQIQSEGRPRSFRVHVPPAYDPTVGAMLVLSFHGFTMEGASMEALSLLDASSDAHGYLVAYPDGLEGSWNGGDCCGIAWTGNVDDVQLARDIVSAVSSAYCVDPRHVHAAGFSNGGFLAERIGCQASDVFASMVSISGVLGIDPSVCTPGRPVPLLDFHGTADPVVHWGGGTPVLPLNVAGPIVFRSVDRSIEFWRTNNACLGAGTVTYQKGNVTCTDYGSCAESADVTLCAIDGGGHSYPDSMGNGDMWGSTTFDVDPDEMGYQFFLTHPMPTNER